MPAAAGLPATATTEPVALAVQVGDRDGAAGVTVVAAVADTVVNGDPDSSGRPDCAADVEAVEAEAEGNAVAVPEPVSAIVGTGGHEAVADAVATALTVDACDGEGVSGSYRVGLAGMHEVADAVPDRWAVLVGEVDEDAEPVASDVAVAADDRVPVASPVPLLVGAADALAEGGSDAGALLGVGELEPAGDGAADAVDEAVPTAVSVAGQVAVAEADADADADALALAVHDAEGVTLGVGVACCAG
jgi:hypothetical protein